MRCHFRNLIHEQHVTDVLTTIVELYISTISDVLKLILLAALFADNCLGIAEGEVLGSCNHANPNQQCGNEADTGKGLCEGGAPQRGRKY